MLVKETYDNHVAMREKREELLREENVSKLLSTNNSNCNDNEHLEVENIDAKNEHGQGM